MTTSLLPFSSGPKIPQSPKRPGQSKRTDDSPLFIVRMKEVDREFSRQTRQLKALTQRLSKKISGSEPPQDD